MVRNIPATIVGMMAGAVVSVSGGAILASYVVAGIAPAYAAPPRLRPSAPVAADETSWPAPDPLGPVSGFVAARTVPDQADGVRASGSSRL